MVTSYIMKNQVELSLGLKVLFPSGAVFYIKSFYYKVKLNNREFLKIKIEANEASEMKRIISKIGECRCSLEWLYLPLDKIKVIQ